MEPRRYCPRRVADALRPQCYAGTETSAPVVGATMEHNLVILRPHPALRVRCSCASRWILTVPALPGETAEETLAYAVRNHDHHVRMVGAVTAGRGKTA